MSQKRIKPDRIGKRKVRGHRAHHQVQTLERIAEQRRNQALAYEKTMTRIDPDTGETYVLSRLALRHKALTVDFKRGLDEAVSSVNPTADDQAEAIRAYLQECVNDGKMIAVSCGRGEVPTCRVYQGANRRIVVIRQDDPDLAKEA